MMTPRSILATLAVAVAATAFVGANAQAGEIHGRQVRQQQRIAQGVTSGRLTAGETARLERREAGLNREIRAMRCSNGGRLTLRERARVDRQQDRLSRRICIEKHDRDRWLW
jgi:hypothetical protein